MKRIILATLSTALLALGCSPDPVETSKVAKEPAINETVTTTGTFQGQSVIMETTQLTNSLSVTIIRPNTTASRSRIGKEGASILIKPDAFKGRNFTYCELALPSGMLKFDVVANGILIPNEHVDDLLNVDINMLRIGKGLDQVYFYLDGVDARALRAKLIRYEFEGTGINIDSMFENNWISDDGDAISFKQISASELTMSKAEITFSKDRGDRIITQNFDEDTKTFYETISSDVGYDQFRSAYYWFDEGNLNTNAINFYECDLKIVSCTETDLVLTIKAMVKIKSIKYVLDGSGNRIKNGNGDYVRTLELNDVPVNYTIHYKAAK